MGGLERQCATRNQGLSLVLASLASSYDWFLVLRRVFPVGHFFLNEASDWPKTHHDVEAAFRTEQRCGHFFAGKLFDHVFCCHIYCCSIVLIGGGGMFLRIFFFFFSCVFCVLFRPVAFGVCLLYRISQITT